MSTIYDGWDTDEEIAAKFRARFGFGTADTVRRWKRQGLLEKYGLRTKNAGRVPLYQEIEKAAAS
jgi:hypothetical protein